MSTNRVHLGGIDPSSRTAGIARVLVLSLLAATLVAVSHRAEARITNLQITKQAPAFGGASFGSVGPYETLTGVAYGEVDPNDSLNAVITDIELAPRNVRG